MYAAGSAASVALKSATLALLSCRVTACRRLHRRGRDDLHEMVHHHVAKCADWVVEVATILHAEVFRHGDLHTVDVVAVPDGLSMVLANRRYRISSSPIFPR